MSLPRSNGVSESNGKVWWIVAPSLALVALTAGSQSQSLSEVSLMYLQRHGVPCQSVVKVASTDNMDEIAICQDGREWAMFWLEDEVAFVRPGSRQFYGWSPDLNSSFPYQPSASRWVTPDPGKRPGESRFSTLASLNADGRLRRRLWSRYRHPGAREKRYV